MNRLIAYFIKFPIWANALIVITGIVGLLSLFLMPKSFFPEMNPNRVYIAVSYPGASPKEIEEGITTRIEESLNGIQGVKEITSKSTENVSNITVKGVEGINVDEKAICAVICGASKGYFRERVYPSSQTCV